MNRRLKMILTVLIMACGFTACWDAEQNRNKVTGVLQDESRSVVMELSAFDDQLTGILQTTTVLLDGYDQEALDQIYAQMEDTLDRYDGLHGVSCLYDSSDQKIVEIVEIDLQQVDLKMLQKEGILSFGTNTIPDGLSLSFSKEYLSNLGFIFD